MTPALAAALADTLLPGDGSWPPGSCTAAVGAILGAAPELDGLVDEAFTDLDGDGREAALRAAERTAPATADRLVEVAYTAYYTDPAVVAVLAAEHGYPPRPPQPLGYELPPFNEAVLEVVRARPPWFRPDDRG